MCDCKNGVAAPQSGWKFELDDWVMDCRDERNGRVVARYEHVNGDMLYQVAFGGELAWEWRTEKYLKP